MESNNKLTPTKSTMISKLHDELLRKRHDPIVPGFPWKRWPSSFAPADLISVTRSGLINEYRVLVSRNEFVSDIIRCGDPKAGVITGTGNTKFHGRRPCNYFWLVCPEFMIEEDEIPERMGLIWVTREGKTGQGLVKRELPTLKTIRRPVRIHDRKIDDSMLADMNRILKERFWSAFSNMAAHEQMRQIWTDRC